MEDYEKEGASGMGMFGCFNTEKAVGARKSDGAGNEGPYMSAGFQISGHANWSLSMLLGLSVVGAVMGAI